MPLKQLTAPAAVPIDVAEARLHVRQDVTADDAKLISLTHAVVDYAQTETWRSIVASRWQQVHDGFPGATGAIELQRSPLIQVVTVEYLSMAGQWQTMPSTDYTVDDTGPAPRITPVFGKIWPIALPQIGAVRVTFDAGYAAPFTASGSTLTVKGHKPLAVGDVLRLSNSGGALPAPLLPDTDYYVAAVPAAGSYQLAATAGGAVIALTDAGTGTHFVGAVPDGLKSWMLLRLDSLYNHRGETTIIQGILAPLPYADRLLDPYRVTL